MEHTLKTDHAVFCGVLAGQKTFEIRYDDRGYKVNDILVLKETQYSGEEMKAGAPLVYTGREITAVVEYILRGPIYGLAAGWVIMSIKTLTTF